MNLKYFDAHCHVQFDMYDPDRDALLARMAEEGVGGLVVGVDLASSQKAVALAERHEHLFASVGLHPNYEPNEWYDISYYRALAQHPKVVAMGECGLDHFRPKEVNEETKRKQKNIFDEQIVLAAELGKPLMIHARPSSGTVDAYHDLIAILQGAKQKYPALRGNVHFFVGGTEEMRELIALDFTVSFTAVITFAREYDDVIRAAPLTHLLSETDAPYVAPQGRRGQRNDPLAAIDVVQKIAEVRGETREKVEGALFENARRLFALP